MDQLYDTIEMCFDITNTNDECDFLSYFINCVISDNEESDIDLIESKDKLFYKEVLYNDWKIRCNFEKVFECSKSAGVNWKVAEELDWFLFYIFHRRFGWPDLEEENGQLKVALPDAQIKFRRSGKAEELKHKSRLVDMLDQIILWLSHQSISAMSILMFSSATRLASKSPVTRLHLSIRGYDWLKDNLTTEITEKLWHALQEFLILGITDFWSRIRDATILRLGPIIEHLELLQIYSLFDELVRLCNSTVNQWQIIDGAIAGICAILKRFQKVGYKSEAIQSQLTSEISSPRFHYQIKIGGSELDRMPQNIISKVQVLAFKLIYHPQQTIRDNTIKAFVLCLDRYYENDIDTAFQNVCQKLSSMPNGSLFTGNIKNKTKIPQGKNQNYQDAYGSQSLICMCHHLFKRLHDKITYLENWHHYHVYFDQYLSHPASSVRIVCSNLYTYAVSQAISYPLLVKNILYNLIIKWNPDQTILLKNINDLIKTMDSNHCKRMSISKIETEKDESMCWEWREGRLLVFELFAKLIIKNHLWYTFGTTEVDSVYSSDNTNSKLNDSDVGSFQSRLNLFGSNSGIFWDKYRDKNEESILSTSLDARRGTVASLPSRNLKFKALSVTAIPFHLRSEEDTKRRQSHDNIFNKRIEDNPESRNLTIKKSSVATSTKNINSLTHSSFLIHVKEIENNESNCNNSKHNINNNDIKLPTFRTLLSQMLHTSAESLIDSQWELRRMAKQALPPLGEVLRWFDPELLVNIINTHLKFEPTLMTSISLQLLHDSLLHTSRLKQLIVNPPSSWQPNIATRVVENIVTCVELNLPIWMKSCQHYLDRSTVFDCITPHAINVIITCITNYFDVVPACALSKSLVDAFVRLDKGIKGYQANYFTINSFEIYPNPSTILSSDCLALDYAIQLIDFVKEGLLCWWQKLSNPSFIREFYDQQKEAILCCSRLMSILASWLHPISEMRGDCGRYLRDIHKLLGFLLKLLMEVMRIDDTTRSIFAFEFVQLLNIFSSYVQYKTIKLDVWWMRQLLDIIFMWLEVFTISELDIACRTENNENKPILFSTLNALLQRFHSTSNRRRATICAIQPNRNFQNNLKHKRLSIDENVDSSVMTGPNFIKKENETNLELFSSQGISENLEYISDESLNDSEGEKGGTYRESHVLSSNSLTVRTHSLPQSLLVLPGKSNSSLIYEEGELEKSDIMQSSSSVNSTSVGEVDASDWDSCSDSEDNQHVTSPKGKDKTSNETVLISELITKIIRFNPNLYEQSKSLLPDFDVTILQGLIV